MTTNNGPDREVDLLVAGAGPAGMAVALVASLEGLDVLLCEKSDQVGGTGSTSAGTLWIPGNSQSRAAGINDSGQQADFLPECTDRGGNQSRAQERLSPHGLDGD
jgi:NADPH-dependent 2,4-dienoyl-CoA reductase/sulfur reductase-like enzyme